VTVTISALSNATYSRVDSYQKKKTDFIDKLLNIQIFSIFPRTLFWVKVSQYSTFIDPKNV